VIYFSDDAGETWQHLSTPVQEPGLTHGNWEPFLRLSNSGVLQFYYSRELGSRDQDNLMRVSHDEGLSWSEAQIISGLEMETRDGMLGLEEIVRFLRALKRREMALFSREDSESGVWFQQMMVSLGGNEN